jgi:hypothetical protein
MEEDRIDKIIEVFSDLNDNQKLRLKKTIREVYDDDFYEGLMISDMTAGYNHPF